jgi:hypothetical protein
MFAGMTSNLFWARVAEVPGLGRRGAAVRPRTQLNRLRAFVRRRLAPIEVPSEASGVGELMAAPSAKSAEPSQSAPTARSWRGRLLAPILTPVLTAVIIALVFFGGVRQGMDHAVEYLENDQWTIAIALSDLVYELNAGYLGYTAVLNKLVEVWNGGLSSHDPAVLDRYKDGDAINRAIKEAASLGPQEPGFIADRTLITMVYSDIGYVDFTKFAFRIFGYKIESLYYTFFLLLSLSAAAYLIVFWSEPAAKMVLLCALFAFFVELHTMIFNPHMPTFPGTRHGSTLALIPAWHFAFMLIYRRRPTAVTVLATLIQLAVLISAIKTRGSAGWTLVFVPAVSVVVGYLQWRKDPVNEKTWQRLLRKAASWPILLLFGGLLVYGQYENSKLHPVYFTDDVLPYHGFWHTAYAGMLDTPDLVPRDSKLDKLYETGAVDQIGFAAALKYLQASRFMPLPPDYPNGIPSGYMSPWTFGPKARLHDEIMRRVVIDIWIHHPVRALKLYLYEKPMALVSVIRLAVAGASNLDWLWYLIVGGVAAFAAIGIADGAQNGSQLGIALVAVAGALPFAALPNIWGYAKFHTIADATLVTLVSLQFIICATCTLAMVFVERYRRQPSASNRDDMARGNDA